MIKKEKDEERRDAYYLSDDTPAQETAMISNL